jgi:hypothetical protein
MSDTRNGEWKLILGSQTREIRGVKGKDSRREKVYSIITSDGRQLILGSYIKLDSIEGLDEKTINSLVEVENVYYQQFGGSQTYHPNLYYAVKHYLTENHIMSPKKDIVKLEDAVSLYLDAEKEFKRLCEIGAKKK